MLVHRIDHRFVLMRARDAEHAWARLAEQVFLDAEATGDDDLSVLSERFADGLEAFLLGAVEEATGIHQHDVRAGIVAREGIALRSQRGHDAFGIDEGLRAAKADEADFRCGLGHSGADIPQNPRKAMIGTLRWRQGSDAVGRTSPLGIARTERKKAVPTLPKV